MHTTRHILADKRFHCHKAAAMVEITITEVLFQGDGEALQEAIAYEPSCSGWQECGAFPGGFPKRLNAVSEIGCPFFDGAV
jgi:hypothetical protein